MLYGVQFAAKIEELNKQVRSHLAAVVDPLFKLFCLTCFSSSYDKAGGFGDFVAAKALAAEVYPELRAQTKRLLRERENGEHDQPRDPEALSRGQRAGGEEEKKKESTCSTKESTSSTDPRSTGLHNGERVTQKKNKGV